MKRILALFRKRWFITVLGFTLLAVLIWLAGPNLATEQGRILLIGSAVGLWIANRLRLYLLAKRDSSRLIDAILGPSRKVAGSPLPDAAEEEIAELKGHLTHALDVEKRARKAGFTDERRFFHQSPWYIVIGPPGVGKTTLLTTSDLRFLIEDERGRGREIKGAATTGTRNCDWFFTNEAVFLDTAGRYISQDAGAPGADKAAWEGFLDLLRKHRRRQPVNGALVAVSLPELLDQPEFERKQVAADIHLRIRELHERLGVRFPIYLLFTKCDLMAGFVEFFARRSQEEQDQVWGVTFPLNEVHPARQASGWRLPQMPAFRRDEQAENTAPSIAELCQSAFRTLEERLNQQLITCLEAESDSRRLPLIYGFPKQFCASFEIAERFLQDVFEATGYETAPMLRGVYFTSGTQDGLPTDRLMASMAATFKVSRQVLPTISRKGQSYFVNQLLREVVFPEEWLAHFDKQRERRLNWARQGVYAGALGVGALAIIAALLSYFHNSNYVALVHAKSVEIQAEAEQLELGQQGLGAALMILNAARTLPGGYADQQEELVSLPGLGIGQRGKLGYAAVEAYRGLLKSTLLPIAIARLENLLAQRGADLGVRYNALQIYLMLFDHERFQRETVTNTLARELETGLEQDRSKELAEHLTALFERGAVAPPVVLNESLVKDVRAELAKSTPVEWFYTELINRRQIWQDIPDFEVSDHAGRDVIFAFSISQTTVPRQYTLRGYHDVFSSEVDKVVERQAKYDWVMGGAWPSAKQEEALEQLKSALRDRYFADYKRHWDLLLSGIDVTPFNDDLNKATEVVRLLSREENSSLQGLLQAVARETALEAGKGIPDAMAKKAKAGWTATKDRFGEFLELDSDNEKTYDGRTLNIVDRNFRKLHGTVRASDDQPAPLGETLGLLAKLKGELIKMEDADGADWVNEARVLSSGPVGELERHAEAEHQPEHLRRWLHSLAREVRHLAGSRALGYLNDAWRTEVWQVYARSLRGRYPLAGDSSIDATLEDFSEFFGPGGRVDNFIESYLQDIVDTTHWSVYSRSRAIPISANTLVQLRRAAEIKSTYFATGAQLPTVHFWVKLLTMDRGVNTSVLALDEQVAQFDTGPVRERELWWPGPEGRRQASIRFEPPSAVGESSTIQSDGSWAWFKLLEQGQVTPIEGQPARFQLLFTIGGRRASYQLRASRDVNPFGSTALREFQCPEGL